MMQTVSIPFFRKNRKDDKFMRMIVVGSILLSLAMSFEGAIYALFFLGLIIFGIARFSTHSAKKTGTKKTEILLEINTYGFKTPSSHSWIKWEEIQEVFVKQYDFRASSHTCICLNLNYLNTGNSRSKSTLGRSGDITISTRLLDVDVASLYHLMDKLYQTENLDKRNQLLNRFKLSM